MLRLLAKLLFPLFLAGLKLSGRSIWSFKAELQRCRRANPLLLAFYDQYFARYGSWIGLASRIAGEPCFPHGPYGVFVSGGARLGANTVIFQQVTIGSDSLADSADAGSPQIGDNVYIGTGAKVIGKVTVGDNCRIGANAVVYSDIPANSVAVQSPTRVIRKHSLDNRFLSFRRGRWVAFDRGAWKPVD